MVALQEGAANARADPILGEAAENATNQFGRAFQIRSDTNAHWVIIPKEHAASKDNEGWKTFYALLGAIVKLGSTVSHWEAKPLKLTREGVMNKDIVFDADLLVMFASLQRIMKGGDNSCNYTDTVSPANFGRVVNHSVLWASGRKVGQQGERRAIPKKLLADDSDKLVWPQRLRSCIKPKADVDKPAAQRFADFCEALCRKAPGFIDTPFRWYLVEPVMDASDFFRFNETKRIAYEEVRQGNRVETQIVMSTQNITQPSKNPLLLSGEAQLVAAMYDQPYEKLKRFTYEVNIVSTAAKKTLKEIRHKASQDKVVECSTLDRFQELVVANISNEEAEKCSATLRDKTTLVAERIIDGTNVEDVGSSFQRAFIAAKQVRDSVSAKMAGRRNALREFADRGGAVCLPVDNLFVSRNFAAMVEFWTPADFEEKAGACSTASLFPRPMAKPIYMLDNQWTAIVGDRAGEQSIEASSASCRCILAPNVPPNTLAAFQAYKDLVKDFGVKIRTRANRLKESESVRAQLTRTSADHHTRFRAAVDAAVATYDDENDADNFRRPDRLDRRLESLCSEFGLDYQAFVQTQTTQRQNFMSTAGMLGPSARSATYAPQRARMQTQPRSMSAPAKGKGKGKGKGKATKGGRTSP
jgi:hypothetical protein